MRILICDDDALMQEQLKTYITSYFNQIRVKCPDLVCFSDGASLLADPGEKDILFLDVEMPGMNGIYAGRELKKIYKNIIIFMVTSYSEYLDEAMRFQVFRYLSKPLERQRFFRNLQDALAEYNRLTVKIPIETRQGVATVPSSEILYVEAQGRKVTVYTLSRTFESIRPMQHWLDLLPKNYFFQTHRSFLVNLQHVSDFDHDVVHMADGKHQAYLTRRKYTPFKEAYFLYLENTR